jgi:hypothetical protein
MPFHANSNLQPETHLQSQGGDSIERKLPGPATTLPPVCAGRGRKSAKGQSHATHRRIGRSVPVHLRQETESVKPQYFLRKRMKTAHALFPQLFFYLLVASGNGWDTLGSKLQLDFIDQIPLGGGLLNYSE